MWNNRWPTLLALATILLLSFNPPAVQPALASSAPSAPAPNLVTGPNLLQNPGFENGLAGWEASGSAVVFSPDITLGHSGCCSAEGISTGQKSLGLLYEDVTGRTSPGSEYRVSGWVKTAHLEGNTTVGLDYFGESPEGLWIPKDGRVIEEGPSTGTTNWTFFESPPFTLPPKPSDSFSLFFYAGLDSSNGSAWFDDLSLAQLTPLPGYIVAAVPLTITNNQSEPTAAPFQQVITFNSSLFGSYESPNLQNVAFFTAGGTAIPSWLESGNSNSSWSTVYWLRLPAGIPAESSLTIYMGFASRGVDLFNGVSVGEAPQLSPRYAQFDDGRSVFLSYYDFAGSGLGSGWATNLPYSSTPGNGSYAVNNGLTVWPNRNSPGYVVSSEAYSAGYAFDSLVTAIGGFDTVGFFNVTEPTAGLTFVGAFVRAAGGYTFPDQWSSFANGPGLGEANHRYGEAFYDETPPFGYLADSVSAPGVYSVNLLTGLTSIQYLNYSAGRSVQPMWADPPGYPLSAGFVAGKNPITVDWARTRSIPPNGVMPSAEYLISRLSSSSIAVRGSVTDAATLAGGTADSGGAVTYEYFAGSACSGSPTTVGASASVIGRGVPHSSSQTFGSAGEYSLMSIYMIDGGGPVESNCAPLAVHESPLLGIAVLCNRASMVIGAVTTCKATVRGPGPAPSGVVTWTSDSSGRFSKPTCRLFGGSCSVTYAPASAGPSEVITASYQTGNSDPPYVGTFALDVNAKASKVAVSCSTSTILAPHGLATVCRVDVVGFSPTGSVDWSQRGAGSVTFSSASCTLSRGACSVTVKGKAAGSVSITAAYLGDANNLGSMGTTTLTVGGND